MIHYLLHFAILSRIHFIFFSSVYSWLKALIFLFFQVSPHSEAVHRGVSARCYSFQPFLAIFLGVSYLQQCTFHYNQWLENPNMQCLVCGYSWIDIIMIKVVNFMEWQNALIYLMNRNWKIILFTMFSKHLTCYICTYCCCVGRAENVQDVRPTALSFR